MDITIFYVICVCTIMNDIHFNSVIFTRVDTSLSLNHGYYLSCSVRYWERGNCCLSSRDSCLTTGDINNISNGCGSNTRYTIKKTDGHGWYIIIVKFKLNWIKCQIPLFPTNQIVIETKWWISINSCIFINVSTYTVLKYIYNTELSLIGVNLISRESKYFGENTI